MHIEKAQKRAIKFIISLKKYSYKDRLIQLNLPTLKYRRLRCDMIEVFKRVKQKYVTAIVPEISVNSSSVTRGNYKLLNQTFTTTYGNYIEDTPRLIWGTRLVSGARLLSEVLRHIYMKWIQDKGQKAARYHHYSTTSAISVLLRCNSDYPFLYIRLLKQSKNFLGMGDWGGAPTRPPSKYAPAPGCWKQFRRFTV